MSRPAIQRRLRPNHNDIKQSNLQSTKQGKNGRRVAQKKRPHPGWLVFSWQPHTAAAKGSICLRSRHMAGNGRGLNDFSPEHILCRLGSRCMQWSAPVLLALSISPEPEKPNIELRLAFGHRQIESYVKACVYLGQVSAFVDCCSRSSFHVVHVVRETGEDFGAAMQQQLFPHHHSGGRRGQTEKGKYCSTRVVMLVGEPKGECFFEAQTGFLRVNYRARGEAMSNAWLG